MPRLDPVSMEPAGLSGSSPTILPTVTSAGSVAGALLGTAAYMSPEQARGLHWTGAATSGRSYDVAPDGQSFVINSWIEEETPRAMSLVLNWRP